MHVYCLDFVVIAVLYTSTHCQLVVGFYVFHQKLSSVVLLKCMLCQVQQIKYDHHQDISC
jgi:hypothetical protein